MLQNYMRTFFFQAEDGIRAGHVTGVQTCALPISPAIMWIVEAMTTSIRRAADHLGARKAVDDAGGSRSAGFEEHLGILCCRAIQQYRRPVLQVPVEERQRVGIDDAVRPLRA